jgi:hypothetical protein
MAAPRRILWRWPQGWGGSLVIPSVDVPGRAPWWVGRRSILHDGVVRLCATGVTTDDLGRKIVTEGEVESLTATWRMRWGGAPIAYEFRKRHADRWVRFHSLPRSKRYAETEEEYGITLARHHCVLAELGADDGLYLIAGYFEDAHGRIAVASAHPGAVPWMTIQPDERSAFEIPMTLHVSTASGERSVVDPFLRAVADDEIAYAIIAPPDLRWLYHPYDGGADVIAPTAHDRDALKDRHPDWLSGHPAGL